MLAFTRCAPSPAQPGEDLGAVLAAGASLPAAVAGQQVSCRVRFDSEPGYDSCERTCRATGQLLRNPAQPRHGAQLDRDAEPVVITLEAGQPRPVVIGEGEEGDRGVFGDVGRPGVQAREFGVGQVADRQGPPDQPGCYAGLKRAASARIYMWLFSWTRPESRSSPH